MREMPGAAAPVPARPAATVLVLRDGPEGLEVFMVVRHHQIDFASGALVFPGGRVEEGDHAIAAALPGEDPLNPFRVAAIREAFEECGLLLARHEDGTPLPHDRAEAITAAHQAAVNAGALSFAALLRAERLVPDLAALAHFAHWITPSDLPKRFDTHFFLAPAPPGHAGTHDGQEAVESLWIRPPLAVAEAEAGRRTLVFATRLNLERLARFADAAAAFAAAAATPVVTVQPEVEKAADGALRMRIPVEAGYGGPLFPLGRRAM
ncbi:NUDIX hydrolase [Crenalkalicoccus roseus]|uniref:NUDIX hydrolase n=1 Tax=Crenalkalicoccus roseus TaxID=1485588 RepID=UPI00195E3AE0|nr:NUDIX domain-containing protein [Crenalkalicoccus roseus]